MEPATSSCQRAGPAPALVAKKMNSHRAGPGWQHQKRHCEAVERVAFAQAAQQLAGVDAPAELNKQMRQRPGERTCLVAPLSEAVRDWQAERIWKAEVATAAPWRGSRRSELNFVAKSIFYALQIKIRSPPLRSDQQDQDLIFLKS